MNINHTLVDVRKVNAKQGDPTPEQEPDFGTARHHATSKFFLHKLGYMDATSLGGVQLVKMSQLDGLWFAVRTKKFIFNKLEPYLVVRVSLEGEVT